MTSQDQEMTLPVCAGCQARFTGDQTWHVGISDVEAGQRLKVWDVGTERVTQKLGMGQDFWKWDEVKVDYNHKTSCSLCSEKTYHAFNIGRGYHPKKPFSVLRFACPRVADDDTRLARVLAGALNYLRFHLKMTYNEIMKASKCSQVQFENAMYNLDELGL